MSAAPGVGDQAPLLELLDFDGRVVSLDALRGQPVVVSFLRHAG